MFLKNYRTVIYIGAFIVAALILLSYGLNCDSGQSAVKKLALGLAAPVQKFFNSSIARVEDAWLRYVHLVGLEEDNRRLKSKVAGLQAELILYQEGYAEAQRLKQLLSLQDDYQHDFIAARVIGKEQAALAKTIWINKGSAHGLKPGMPVMAMPGLIGRLTDVSWQTSKVMLLTDENSNVDVMIQRTRVQGILRGAGSRGCVVKYVSKIQDVREGDVLVTSGLSNIFPKGLLVGTASHANRRDDGLFWQIQAAPFADFTVLEEVLVLVRERLDVAEGKKPVK